MDFYDCGIIKETRVDLVETFNFLLGLRIIWKKAVQSAFSRYICIFGTKKLPTMEKIIIIWSLQPLDPPHSIEEERLFLINNIIEPIQPDEVYMNGAPILERAKKIEPFFQSLMFSESDR